MVVTTAMPCSWSSRCMNTSMCSMPKKPHLRMGRRQACQSKAQLWHRDGLAEPCSAKVCAGALLHTWAPNNIRMYTHARTHKHDTHRKPASMCTHKQSSKQNYGCKHKSQGALSHAIAIPPCFFWQHWQTNTDTCRCRGDDMDRASPRRKQM